jgi:hypothetical protein
MLRTTQGTITTPQVVQQEQQVVQETLEWQGMPEMPEQTVLAERVEQEEQQAPVVQQEPVEPVAQQG